MDMEFCTCQMEECMKEPGSPTECMEKATKSYQMDRNIWFIRIMVKEWISLRLKKTTIGDTKTLLHKIIKSYMINWNDIKNKKLNKRKAKNKNMYYNIYHYI